MALPTGVPWEEELSDAPYGKQEESGTVGPGALPGGCQPQGRPAGTHLGVVFALRERGELQFHVLHGPRAPAGGCGAPGRPPGLAEATREGGRADGRLTRGGLTASTRGLQGPGGCDRKADGRAVRCRPPCCGRLPPAGLRAPQTAGIRPRLEPITVSSRPNPRATANPSPRSPTARPRRRQVSARLRPARPRARRRGGRGLPRGGAAAEGKAERSGKAVCCRAS